MRTTLLILAALSTTALAQQNLFREVFDPKSDSYIDATALFSKPPPGGFLPVRVTIANHTTSPQPCSLSFTTSCGYYGDNNGSKTSLTFDFSTAAGHTESHDILVPTSNPLVIGYNNNISIHVVANGTRGYTHNGNIDPEFPAVLLSESLHTPNSSALDAELKTLGSGRSYLSYEFAAKFDPRTMPDDWRAFVGYDCILMTDHDWESLSPGTRNAILAQNRLGGKLIIYQLSSSNDLASLGIDPDAHGKNEIKRSYGKVRLETIRPDLKLDPPATIKLVGSISHSTAFRAKSLREDFSAHWPLQSEFGEKTFHYGQFIFILVIFGILVGPINLFVFAKAGQRHRMFITTPLISLGASLLMIGMILVMDGIGGKGVRTVLMEVRPDNGENAAYLHQEQFSRTGVLLGTSFTMSEPSIITAVPLAPSRWARVTSMNGGGGAQYTYHAADRKWTYSGDWFQSRSEQGQSIESVIPTRGRIELVSKAGVPSFLSSFNFPLAEFYYVDSSGGAWKASNITTGKTFTCESITKPQLTKALNEQRTRFTNGNAIRFDALSPADRRASFIAITEAGPCVNTYDSVHWVSTHTVVTGPVLATK